MHLLFDLDGTLTDSRIGIIRSLQHSLAANQLPVPEAADLLWCIGPPILESFARLVGSDSSVLFTSTVACYRERYSEIGLYENEVYPEIQDTLSKLLECGYTLHVATSKAEIYAKRIISHFGLHQYFTSVNGSDLDGTRAVKSELIAHILLQQGISANKAIMIGDREHDMMGASKNGIPAIGVLWGYGTGNELIASGASLCARAPHLLPELISSLKT